jgi:hypothetical protein
MSLEGISSATSSTSTSTAAAAQQEATETEATTKSEAAKGDQQAIKKLAKEEQAQQAKNSEPGKGEKIDYTA